MKKLKLICLIFVLLFLSSASLFSADKKLQNDSRLISGKLKNGFEYLIYKNQKPEDRIDIRLLVKTGSYYENDDEEGIAHFLEHMVFNGTTNFKPDELIKYFQSVGMSYSADVNAYTSFFKTVYKIFLPKGNIKDLEKGLLVLYDYANGALLLDEEIKKESKVVLAEKRERDSIGYRQHIAYLKFLFQNGRAANRLPIGKEDDIKSFDRTKMKTFYDNWYYPSNMVLVVVGDFDEKKMESLVKKRFEDIKRRGEILEAPPLTTLKHTGIKPYYFFDEEEKEVRLTIETAISKLDEDSFKKRESDIYKKLAELIMQERLDIREREIDCPFFSANFYSFTYLKNIKNSAISAISPPYNWIDTFVEIETTLRRALEFGFSEQELSKAKQKLLSSLEINVQKENGRDTRKIAQELINTSFNNKFFLSPTQESNLFEDIIQEAKLKNVESAFKKMFEPNHRLISLVGRTEIEYSKKNGEKKILEIYEKSKKIPIEKIEDEKKVVFPYLTPPEKECDIKIKEINALGIKVIKLSNGVTINLKQNSFKQNEVIFSLAFGKGKSSLPIDKDGLPFLTQMFSSANGFGKLNLTNLNNLLHSHNTNISFDIKDDAFTISGTTLKKRMKFLFELLYTYLLDHKYTDKNYLLAQKRAKQLYPNFLNTVEGIMQVKGNRIIANGDNRFGMPENYNIIKKITLNDYNNWYIKSLENSPLELSIAGDFDEDEIIFLSKQYLGTLSKREKIKIAKRDDPTFKNAGRTTLFLRTRIPKTIVKFSYPINDTLLNSKNEIDIEKIRRLNVLGMTLYENLRKDIREEMGEAYSPYAYFSHSYIYPNSSKINIEIKTTKEQKFKLIKAVKKVVSKLSEIGTNEENLSLVLNPMFVHIKDIKKENSYWLKSVMENSSKMPEKFKWAKNMLEDYKSINAKEINEMAKKYLKNKNAHIVVVQARD